VRLQPSREIEFEHFYQTLQAAQAGAGFAIGPIALVYDDIVAGTLAAPKGLIADGTSYALMAPRTAPQGGAFDLILSWLLDMMKPVETYLA
jgi:DNA-binding transcriptional LysR family regulator